MRNRPRSTATTTGLRCPLSDATDRAATAVSAATTATAVLPAATIPTAIQPTAATTASVSDALRPIRTAAHSDIRSSVMIGGWHVKRERR